MGTSNPHTSGSRALFGPSGLLFLLFFLLNLALKLPFLGAQPIALDEPFSIFHAQQSLPDLFELFPKENNPPLHYLVLHVFIRLFGIGAWSVRLPSLIASCLAAALLFRSGERHFGRSAGLVAATVFTLCNFHIYHAHEARTYGIFVLLTVLALDRFLRLADEPRKTSHYLWLGIWNALLIYSHFLGFWVILVQGAGFFLLRNKGQLWWRLGLMWLGTGLLYLPYLYVLMARVDNYSSVGTWVWQPHWTELYGNINRFLNGKAGTLAVGLVILLGVGRTLRSGKIQLPDWVKERKLWVVAVAFGLIWFGMYGISFVVSPVFLDRYLLYSTVPLFLLLGALVDGFFERGPLKWAALGILVAGMGMNLDPDPSNERPTADLVERIRVEQGPGVPLFICPPYRDLEVLYHLDRDAFADYRNKEAHLRQRMIFPLSAAADIPDSSLQSQKALYFDADSEFTHPGNGIRERLTGHFSRENKVPFGVAYTLWIYSGIPAR